MDAMTATNIVAEVRTVYSTYRSHRDTGEVWLNWEPDDPEPHRTFSTAFVRPDRFRLEVARKAERVVIIHLDARRVRARFNFLSPTLKQLRESSVGFWRRTALTLLFPALRGYLWSLDRALRLAAWRGRLDIVMGAAMGVSQAANVTPLLLVPERLAGRDAMASDDLERVDDKDLDGVPYYRVTIEETHVIRRGKSETKHSHVVFWVDQQTFLLRRIESCWWNTGPHRWRICTGLCPELNVPIAEEELEFSLHV